LNEATFLGPLADKIQFDRAMKFLEQDRKDALVVAVMATKETIFLDPPSDT
jgi:hypothetical protein